LVGVRQLFVLFAPFSVQVAVRPGMGRAGEFRLTDSGSRVNNNGADHGADNGEDHHGIHRAKYFKKKRGQRLNGRCPFYVYNFSEL
jgi:hypothetical protein